MFRRILLAFTDPELRGKIIKIILLILAARILAHVPIPLLGIQDISNTISNDTALGLLDVISGGSFGRLSFVMLGISPYITASIIFQLLGVLFPRIREIQREEGEQGKNKINRWTRFLTVPLAAIQAWGILNFLASDKGTSTPITLPDVLTPANGAITLESFMYWSLIVGSMAIGSLIIMWIGEIITEFKMGNGISIMILAGIVSRLPGNIYTVLFGEPGSAVSTGVIGNMGEAFQRFFANPSVLANWDKWQGFWYSNSYWAPSRNLVYFILVFLFTLLFVVFINDAVRRIIIIYSRRGHNEGMSRTMAHVKADLPVKVNQAGVIPIIFSVSFVLFPAIVARFFQTANQKVLVEGAKSVSDFLSADNNIGAHFLRFQISNKDDVANGVKWFSQANATGADGQPVSIAPIHNYSGLDWFQGFGFQHLNFDWLPNFTLSFDGILAYNFFYFFFIIFFTYFYTTIIFNTEEVSEDLQKSGAYIPGYRPGKETADYLNGVSNRLNVAGSVFLAVIALLPILLSNHIALGSSRGLSGIVGGTTLLILVAVTIETLKQIETQAISIDYDRFSK
ncbi:MAG: hypothetical protein OHK0017_04150 [Patescibacteria group bacterium]